MSLSIKQSRYEHSPLDESKTENAVQALLLI